MSNESITRVRNVAASLLTLAGCGHIALLWLQDIDRAVLGGALFGAVYLIVAIGLYGQSLFSVFMAILVPAAGLWFTLQHSPIEAMHFLVLAVVIMSFLVILGSTVVLFALHRRASL